jgi:predicted GH43/DUF377 family glycosyl hydrolase
VLIVHSDHFRNSIFPGGMTIIQDSPQISKMLSSFIISLMIFLRMFCDAEEKFNVNVLVRDTKPLLSFIDQTSTYQQIFNPTWVEPTTQTNFKRGLLVRTQNCDSEVGGQCVFCGGSQDKASILTFSEQLVDGSFKKIDTNSVVFGPSDSTDSWGTEDPRMKFNPNDELYYMFYTAYNGSAIFLNLARTKNPTNTNEAWERLGPVFPSQPGSKSAALLLRGSPPHYLLWGDHDIRITQSNDPSIWKDIGNILISPREDHFDSRLVESGPPPMKLSNGDYLFFYNSAELDWPDDPKTAYHVGWLILDGQNPMNIKARSETPLLGPEFTWETGIFQFLF